MKDRQGLVNQLCLDLLLRRLGTTVLRRKFKEIYAKINGGKEWTDGPEAGQQLCQTKWGNEAFANASSQVQEMMQRGIILNWDLHCLQSVVTNMLSSVLEDVKQKRNGSIRSNKGPTTLGKMTPLTWDPSWWEQLSDIRTLANIRHSVAHMPSESLSQSDFDKKWDVAVDALMGLGANSREIEEILQISESTFKLQSPVKYQQGQMSSQSNKIQGQVSGEIKTKEKLRVARDTIEELRAQIQELQIQSVQTPSEVTSQDEIKMEDQKDKVEGQLAKDNIDLLVINKKNQVRVNALTKKGNLAGRSGDWDKAQEFYTRALEIPDSSDDQRTKIYLNRSWVHLKILQMPEPPVNLNVAESVESKIVDDELFDDDHPKWRKKLSEELREFHLTAGMADAESALRLSPGQKCSKANYRLAQFHQIKGDWTTALTYYDLALDQSDLDDLQLEVDRNACQLELLNQTEVEEFPWIPGGNNQSIAGLFVRRNPQKWIKVMNEALNDPQQKFYAKVVKGHLLAQGLVKNKEDSQGLEKVCQIEQAAKLYEEAGKGGLVSGLYNCGLLLQEGNGTSQRDFSGAVCLFKTAANFLNAKSEKDKETADREKEGVLEAQYRMGVCYEFGLGVGKCEKEALQWYETASLGDFAKASRKLGDIYSQGLLGVSKDMDMAIKFWDKATTHGDTVAGRSIALHLLKTRPATFDVVQQSLSSFSKNVICNFDNGTENMVKGALASKNLFQAALATVLNELAQSKNLIQEEGPGFVSDKNGANEDREPEEVSWNVPAFVEHTLHTTHLLELAQTLEFQQKLEAIPNWSKQFIFTGRLMRASNCCIEGLTAFKELNKLYQECLIKAYPNNQAFQTNYPPDLQRLSDVDEVSLEREGQLVTLVLISFVKSIKLAGAVFLRDQPTQELIFFFVKKCYFSSSRSTQNEINNSKNAAFLFFYLSVLQGIEFENILKTFKAPERNIMLEPYFRAVVESVGKLETIPQDLNLDFQRKLLDVPHPHLNSNPDLLFVTALCCKSAALTRGVNSANRKKVKEAMGHFKKFLEICPMDEPRRAEAHYQLGLCTLYLEKMKVKGQSKSLAQTILDKVIPHFTQGEAVEQEFPWKDLQVPHKSSVKLLLQRKMKELQVLVKKVPDSEGEDGNSENSCVARLVDPWFKFPTSSAPLKVRKAERVQVITRFRKLLKAVYGATTKGSSTSSLSYPEDKFLNLFNLPDTPFTGSDVLHESDIVGCYEILDPVLIVRWTKKQTQTVPLLTAYTLVQDESGAVFNLQLVVQPNQGGEQLRASGIDRGARIIINRPHIRLDADGGTSLMMYDACAKIFVLPPTTEEEKCGFCGKTGRNLQKCVKCQEVYYCSKECQTADWNELKHNWICAFIKIGRNPS